MHRAMAHLLLGIALVFSNTAVRASVLVQTSLSLTQLRVLPSSSTIVPLVPLPPSLSLVTSLGGLGPNDFTKWSQLGPDQTPVGVKFKATSAAGVAITGSFLGDNAGGLVSVVCPPPPAPFPFPCSWTGGTGGKKSFSARDSLVWTFDGSNYNGPLSLTFGFNLSGAGALIQSEFPGPFTAEVQAGGDTFTESSDANGDPLFIGVIGTGGAQIDSLTLGIAKCTAPAPSICDVNDFAVDTLYTTGGPAAPVPEPALVVPLAGALAALAWKKLRRPAGPLRNTVAGCFSRRFAMRRARFALLVLSLGVRAGLAQTIPIWTQSIAPCPIVAVVVGPGAPGSAVLPPCGTRDFKSHTVTMVGRNPFLHGHIKTGIKTQLVSVKLLFANAGPTYDPTVATSRLVDINGVKLSVEDATNDSPIFQNATWKMNGVDVGSGVTGGALQYGDAFQRANFWRYVGGTPHQTVLTPLDLRATAVINVPAGMGVSMANCNGNKALGPCGLAALGWWDPVAQGIIANPANNIGPDTFVIFIFDSVQLYLNTISVLAGYHSSFTDRNGFTRTYAVADFDTSGVLAKTAPDVMVLSHEVGEWMDDPVIDTPTVKSGEGGEGGNQVAGWGPYGQQTGCQTNLEVGDPSSQPTPKPPPVKGPITPKPFVMMLNNFKYHLQELNYFSWFLGANAGNPSIAVANGFSNNGSFTTDAGLVCK